MSAEALTVVTAANIFFFSNKCYLVKMGQFTEGQKVCFLNCSKVWYHQKSFFHPQQSRLQIKPPLSVKLDRIADFSFFPLSVLCILVSFFSIFCSLSSLFSKCCHQNFIYCFRNNLTIAVNSSNFISFLQAFCSEWRKLI